MYTSDFHFCNKKYITITHSFFTVDPYVIESFTFYVTVKAEKDDFKTLF